MVVVVVVLMGLGISRELGSTMLFVCVREKIVFGFQLMKKRKESFVYEEGKRRKEEPTKLEDAL